MATCSRTTRHLPTKRPIGKATTRSHGTSASADGLRVGGSAVSRHWPRSGFDVEGGRGKDQKIIAISSEITTPIRTPCLASGYAPSNQTHAARRPDTQEARASCRSHTLPTIKLNRRGLHPRRLSCRRVRVAASAVREDVNKLPHDGSTPADAALAGGWGRTLPFWLK
jgi:hypothetical protein